MNTPRWSELASAFSDEAFLPDGLVEHTDSSDWQATLNLAVCRGWHVRSPDGRRPENLSADHLLADEHSHTIAIWPSSAVQINLFLNGASEIGFDFSTREVIDQSSLDVLCGFLRSLGGVVRKPVKIYFEGSSVEILRYDPGPDHFLIQR